jgi:hypothetical protein
MPFIDTWVEILCWARRACAETPELRIEFCNREIQTLDGGGRGLVTK